MTVHLHIGQCGVQLGAAYWRLAAAARDVDDEYESGAQRIARTSRTSGGCSIPSKTIENPNLLYRHLFHRATGAARCILVDSEPKVIRSVCDGAAPRNIVFHPAHIHAEKSGCGNNWAMGYYGPKLKAPGFTSLTGEDRKELLGLVEHSIRCEIEALDCYQGTVVMHSLGGGTGSGLSCRVLESMRDTYPKAYLMAVSIAPSLKTGDTPLQNYNAMLTLQCLQEVADAVVYKDNDELLRTAGFWKTLSPMKDAADIVSLAEVNNIAAADLAGLLFPISMGVSNISRSFDFGKFVHDACPVPAFKIIDVRSGVWRDRAGSNMRCIKTSGIRDVSTAILAHTPVVPQVRSLLLRHETGADTDASLDVIQQLVHQCAASFPSKMLPAFTLSAILRGFSPSPSQANRCLENLGGIIKTAFPTMPWSAPAPQTMLSYSSRAPFPPLHAKASATLCVNNGHFLTSTKRIVERARRQFQAGAYVHWYKQHGLEDADFELAFDKCATLVSEYEAFLR